MTTLDFSKLFVHLSKYFYDGDVYEIFSDLFTELSLTPHDGSTQTITLDFAISTDDLFSVCKLLSYYDVSFTHDFEYAMNPYCYIAATFCINFS